LVDVTHEIRPQDIDHGAYVLSTITHRFPRNTVHVAVVDPGVGTDRRPIIAEYQGCLFIGPDNGLLTSILRDPEVEAVHEITNTDMMAKNISRTFQGRDVFAPAAAHASRGSSIHAFGPSISDPVLMPAWDVRCEGNRIVGHVVHVDRFGNLITNLGVDLLRTRKAIEVRVGGHTLKGVSETYGNVAQGSALALIGSQATVEVSVNGGNASEVMGVARGGEVTLVFPA
jgi:S-adenosylmethionine hydrolase